MNRSVHVAVLGAGIMGSATALFLARRGARVTLFDAAPLAFARASRWNEGKIHLGHLYSADPSLETARRVLPGGLMFKPLVEELIGEPIAPAISAADDVYLAHRASVVPEAAMERYFASVAALTADHPDVSRYLVDASDRRVRKLTAAELAHAYDTRGIVAGFRIPERSVNTNWIADRFVAALDAEPRMEIVLSTKVIAVRPRGETLDSQLLVETSEGAAGPFDFVVNALWEGRLQVDAPLGILPAHRWSHRYRQSLFVRTRAPIDLPSTVIAVGPFGDLKNYNGRDLYLSWYPAGLLAEGEGIAPPPVPPTDPARFAAEVFDALGDFIPAVDDLAHSAESIEAQGGWVYAEGAGPLDVARSTIHRRDRIGVTRRGSYFSVDTGKYSIAPWLAAQVADAILG